MYGYCSNYDDLSLQKLGDFLNLASSSINTHTTHQSLSFRLPAIWEEKETDFPLWSISVWYKSYLYILIETSMEAGGGCGIIETLTHVIAISPPTTPVKGRTEKVPIKFPSQCTPPA